MIHRPLSAFFALACASGLLVQSVGHACTGIMLGARDGAVVYGRTMEWGAFDFKSRLVIVPRGMTFAGRTPDGQPGVTWRGKFGMAGIDILGQDVIVDGMNEKGLTAGLFYHPGFAEYQAYDPSRHAESMSPTDVGRFLLSTCATVDEARAAMARVRVVPLVEPALGFTPPVHYMVAEPSGKAIVIEFLKGELKVFDAPLGVITNAPSYDWHETNLRNYVNLSAVAIPDRKILDLDFKPLGVGSGMVGLPGDFTPPSRFVRAVAFTRTARTLTDGDDAIYELFRILDNFNVPLTPAEGSGVGKSQGMLSSTLWTSGYDTKNRILYFHTQHNRRVRRVDLNKIDFGTLSTPSRVPLDQGKGQDFEEVVPTP